MSISPMKRKILEALWKAGKPLKLEDIAKEAGLSVSSSKEHVFGLLKAKHLSTPKENYYAITDIGKEALGFKRIDKTRALSVLRSVPLEKAFHFYTGIDEYMGIYANSLSDFCSKIQSIDVKSIEFHMPRKDFESWLHSLGDTELATKIGLIRNMGLSRNSLRKKVYETVKSRHEELVSLFRGVR